MKKLQRLISLICVCAMMCSMSALAADFSSSNSASREISPEEFFAPEPVYTPEQIHEILVSSPNTVSYNEFDLLIQMKIRAQEVLADDSSTQVEIQDAQSILAYDPRKRVYEYQQLPDAELAIKGFDEDRIQAIRNFSGEINQLRAIGANCDFDLYNEKYSIVSGKRWASVSAFFEWDMCPFFTSNDAIAIGGNSTFYPQKTDGTTCSIYYKDNLTESKTILRSYTKNDLQISPFLVTNAGFSFPVAIVQTSSSGTDTAYYSKTGYATMGFMSVDDRQVMLSGAHAHAVRTISASIGIDFSNSVSVGASLGLNPKSYDLSPDVTTSYVFSS